MGAGPTRRTVLKGLAGASALAATGVYGLGVEPLYRLRVQRYAPDPPAWPPGLRLTIAALADIHVGEPTMPLARVEEIVAATNALRPDLVVLLGDYAAGHPFVTRAVANRDFAAAIAGLRAPLGVHAILGNHDWWDDPAAQSARRGPPQMRRDLEAAGIPVLENEAVRILAPDGPFWLLGLGDQIAFRRARGLPTQGVDRLWPTMQQITDGAPAILLAHEPDIFHRTSGRVALTLAGHTHGGQLRVLGYSPVVPSRFGQRYAYGHVVQDGRHMIVSGGLGTGLAPFRLGVPPEIVLVALGTPAQLLS
jgi:predicted MPP superfamily phosphohydrolase